MTGKNPTEIVSKVRTHFTPTGSMVTAFNLDWGKESPGYDETLSVFVSVFIYDVDEPYSQLRERTSTQVKAFESIGLKDERHMLASGYYCVENDDLGSF
jgi:hypothetical protein